MVTLNEKIIWLIIMGVLFGLAIGLAIFEAFERSDKGADLATAALAFCCFIGIISSILISEIRRH